MDHNSTPPNDLEKLLREQLGQLNASPDDETWAQIAARQSRRNVWWRWRRRVFVAVPVVALLLLGGLGWQRWSALPPAAPEPPAGPTREMPEAGMPLPIAALPPASQPMTPEGTVRPASGQPHTAQSYGARINTVPAAAVRFRAEAGVQYQSPVSGTGVFIPANSLVDANGQPVSGEVELQFREYRGIGDFLAAGMPMHYGDTRGTFFFNSGGMVDVRVSQNGEPLQMAPGQTYDLNFVPTDRLTAPSLYYFEESTQAWQYRPAAAFASQTGPLPTIVNEATVIAENTDGQSADCLPALLDMLPQDAANLQDGIQTGYELAMGQLTLPPWFRRNPGMSNEQLLNGLERGTIRVVRDRDGIDQLFPEDLDHVFTELQAFKNAYFIRRVDSLPHSKITRQLSEQQYWERIYIIPEQGNNCRIVLYTRTQKVEFFAKIVPILGVQAFEAEKVLAEYVRLREERQQHFEALVMRLRQFLFAAPMFQTPREWCLQPSDWMAYFEQNRPLMQARYAALIEAGLTTDPAAARTAWQAWQARIKELYYQRANQQRALSLNNTIESLTYALRLNSFGLYNCDQIFRLGSGLAPSYVYARYETPDGRELSPAAVSILDRQSRTFFSLPYNDRLILAPGRSLDVIVTGRDGRSYHFSAQQYARRDLQLRETNRIPVQDVTERTRTPREWDRYLEM